MRRVTPQPIIGNDLSASLLDRFREYSVALNQCADHRLSEFVQVVANYTAGQNDHVIECAPSGAMTVTLPAASVMRNKRIVIKRTNNTTHTVTIQSSSGNIDGAASVTLTTAHQSREVFSDGANWWLLDTGATAPTDPYWANVVLMLHMDGTDGSTTFTDSSSYARTPSTNSNVAITTDKSQFGGAAGERTAGSAILEYAYSTDFSYAGSNAYTIEFWLFLQEAGATEVYFLGQRSGTGKYFRITTAETMFFRAAGAAELSFGTIAKDVWSHIALTCDGTTVKSFVNGLQINSDAASSFTDTTTTAFSIFSASSIWTTAGLVGYLDDVRFTQGIARYTSDFDVPTEAFPNQ